MEGMENGTGSVNMLPDVGVLSRTISTSSNLRWIVPAKLRNARRNDIVFVGETSIQLREFLSSSGAHLVDVTANFSFGTTILAARVISAATVPIDVLEQTVKQTYEDTRYVLNGEQYPDDEPPQILALSLASCEWVFVYAREQHDGTVCFQWARRPILAGVDLPDRFGRHMAVDPGSRALTFAPSMGQFAIAALRPVNEIKEMIDSWSPSTPSSFTPWTEQHFIQVDGHIVRMDFLQSADTDHAKVILVLIVANAGQTQLLLYQWNSRGKLHSMKPMRCSGQVLESRDSHPLMLIPCKGLSSFFLVTETELALYSQVTASRASRSAYSFNFPSGSFAGARPPLFTHWAKPHRHHKYKEIHDDMMLVREDGLLQYFVITYTPQPKVRVAVTAGQLGFNVDRAFCLLAGPQSLGGGDVLLVGGNLTDGGVFHLPSRELPSKIQSLPNIAPLNDLILLQDDNMASERLSRPRILACSGSKDGAGSIVQILHGLEAHIGWSMELTDNASINDIWSLEMPREKKLYLLFSHSTHTSVVIYGLRSAEFEFANQETHPTLDLDQPTLVAATLGGATLLQVTATSINIMSKSDEFASGRRTLSGRKALCATLIGKHSLAVAHALSDGFVVRLLDLRHERTIEDAASIKLDSINEPLCMSASSYADSIILLVSTKQGQIVGYVLSDNNAVRKLFDLSLKDVVEDLGDSTVSSICLLSHPSSCVSVLLCGLRSGYALAVELHTTETPDGELSVEYRHTHVQPLGTTTVTITPDHHNSRGSHLTAAFATCRSTFKRISLMENPAGSDISSSSIFIVSPGDKLKSFPVINAVHRIARPQSDPTNDIADLVVTSTPDTVLFSKLINQQRAVPCHTPVPGVPKRLMYSSFLERVVVGLESESGPGLVFLASSPDHDEVTYLPSQVVSIGTTAEKIQSVIGYQPMDDEKHFEFLVVALNAANTDTASRNIIPTGHVVCLSLPRIKNGKLDSAKPHTIYKCPGKRVTCLSIVGKSGLLIGTERQLVLINFVMKTRSWKTSSAFDLPSAATAIEISSGKIMVGTRNHSWLLLRESKNELVMLASDSSARNVSAVLRFDGRQTLVGSISEKGTTVSGLTDDPHINGLLKTFEGSVPPLLDRIVEETSDLFGNREHSSFIGNTIDGTMMRFITLKADELKLLVWLQRLHQEKKGSAKRRLASRPRRDNPNGAQKTSPSMTTHVDGDLLALMIEPGVMSLREVLGPRIKDEGETTGFKVEDDKMQELNTLAAPLFEHKDDVVGSTIIWLRRLLNWQAA